MWSPELGLFRKYSSARKLVPIGLWGFRGRARQRHQRYSITNAMQQTGRWRSMACRGLSIVLSMRVFSRINCVANYLSM